MGKNFGKNISKNFSGKYSQKLLDHAKQSPTTGDLIGNKIPDKITKVSKTSQRNKNSCK